MSYTWFKLHHDMPDDIKLRRFTPQEKWAWVALLCLASKEKVRGQITAEDEDIAEYCEFNSPQDWLYYRDKLIAKGMLEINGDGHLSVLHWEDRQYDKPSDKPEAVKARVAKHRAAKKTAKPTDETPCNALQTQGNADETPQTRLDTDKTRSDSLSESPSQPVRKNKPVIVDRFAMQFQQCPWRPSGKLDAGFCEFVGKAISFDGDKESMHPRQKGRSHILNLEKTGSIQDLEKLEGYWEDHQDSLKKTAAVPTAPKALDTSGMSPEEYRAYIEQRRAQLLQGGAA